MLARRRRTCRRPSGREQSEAFDLADEPLPRAARCQCGDAAAAGVEAAAGSRRAAGESRRRAAFRAGGKGSQPPTVGLWAWRADFPTPIRGCKGTYSAAGVNVNIPILNGKLYAARRNGSGTARAGRRKRRRGSDRADLRAGAGWHGSRPNTAFRRLDVTARLVAQAEQEFAARADPLRQRPGQHRRSEPGAVEPGVRRDRRCRRQVRLSEPARRTGIRDGSFAMKALLAVLDAESC